MENNNEIDIKKCESKYVLMDAETFLNVKMGKKIKSETHKEKNKGGRPRIYTEKTRSLSMQVPVSHYERLKSILDYELDKLKIKKEEMITISQSDLAKLIKSQAEKNK